MNTPNWLASCAGLVAFILSTSSHAVSADPSELKGFIFGQTTIDEWRDAVHEERASIVRPERIEVVAPFCSSEEGDYFDNALYFSDEEHNPALGIESCFRYDPSCADCISSLAQAATDRNTWTFLDGILVRMRATLYRTQLINNLLDPLFAKYGEPSEVTVQLVTNSFGAQFESRVWRWHLDSLEILVIERAGQIDKSFVSFGEPNLEQEMNRRLEAVVPDTSNL